jgi:hypothetical protein
MALFDYLIFGFPWELGIWLEFSSLFPQDTFYLAWNAVGEDSHRAGPDKPRRQRAKGGVRPYSGSAKRKLTVVSNGA